MKLTKEDRVWRDAVKERDDYTCQYPTCGTYYPEGQRQGFHAHHIFTRTRKATKTDVRNGISLCFAHHMWAHGNPLEFHEWMRDRLGAEYDELQRLSRSMVKS